MRVRAFRDRRSRLISATLCAFLAGCTSDADGVRATVMLFLEYP
jgi:hypothetical protein